MSEETTPKNNLPEAPLMDDDDLDLDVTEEETTEEDDSPSLVTEEERQAVQQQQQEAKEEEKQEEEEKSEEESEKDKHELFVLRTTANREEQVVDFVFTNASKKGLEVYSVVHPHGMRGYVFIEAATRSDAEQVAFNIPYARGILPAPVKYTEIEHMLEQVKKEVNIQKGDIVEVISGPFKREKAKVTRLDKTKEEVVVELLESAVPIPITLKLDAVKVIRRDKDEGGDEETEELDDFDM